MSSPSLVARPPSPPDALGWASALVDPAMEAAVVRLHPELRPPVEHHLAGGGKRVRAALAVLSAAASGGRPEEGIVGAVAVELVHNFSLLHDDVIDGDAERRHRPTVWIQFGVGPAIIAGDALMTLAMQVLLEEGTPHAAGAASALAGATQQMIAGQALDMAFETSSDVSLQDCLAMSRGKTGALLGCASSIGAELAGASPGVVEALRNFGTHMGVAFQAVDDVLGIWGEPAVTGKPAGNDLVQHKKSVPVAAVLRETALGQASAEAQELATLLSGAMTPPDAARAADLLEERGGRRMAIELADAHLDAALEALGSVTLEPGPAGQLAEIARYVVERDR
jgi:geranylgeranyl diphosphate synthase, type I